MSDSAESIARPSPGAVVFYFLGAMGLAIGILGALKYGVDRRTTVFAVWTVVWVAGGEFLRRNDL